MEEKITDYSKMCCDCKFYFPLKKRKGYGHCVRFEKKKQYYRKTFDYNLVASGKIACEEFSN